MNVYKVLQLYLLQLCTYTSSSTISSAVFKLTASDTTLAGHVFRKCRALTALDCAHECLAERPACKSINFITRKQADSVMNCELNNATKSAHPIKLYLAKNVNYYEIIEKRRTTGASVSSVQNAIGTFHANFTNLGASGRLGPQSLGSEYLSKDNENMVTVKEGIQFWTVPWTGTYEITAVGAAGGKDKYGLPGGRGANMKGEFDLKKGDVIKILVGQEGAKTDLIGGGGGGTFVATITNTPMIVAGGGGGAQGLNNQLLNCDASTETTGKSNACSPGSSCSIWAGGANGTGALYGDAKSGGGGGGFYSNGTSGESGGGKGFILGGEGGLSNKYPHPHGGFGGGGAGVGGGSGGGGGGGYSGGAPGPSVWDSCGGGGGSFNGGKEQVNKEGYRESGHGFVEIKLLN